VLGLLSNDELETGSKEAALAWSKYYPGILPEGLGKTRKVSLRIAYVPAEIRTVLLPNASLESYSYSNPLGAHMLMVSSSEYVYSSEDHHSIVIWNNFIPMTNFGS
jgi:hypothetical protein